MKILIQYKGSEFLPKEISDAIDVMERKICDDHLEYDKIICHTSNLRGQIIRFLATHGKMIK